MPEERMYQHQSVGSAWDSDPESIPNIHRYPARSPVTEGGLDPHHINDVLPLVIPCEPTISIPWVVGSSPTGPTLAAEMHAW
jgi:hypothetical protein